jgi:hypothetical protein
MTMIFGMGSERQLGVWLNGKMKDMCILDIHQIQQNVILNEARNQIPSSLHGLDAIQRQNHENDASRG